MIKNLLPDTWKFTLTRLFLGKIWEFVFLVDDYHYTMTHSWGWILSVRIFFPTIVLNSHQRLEFWKHQTVPTLSALPWFTPRIAVASFRRWRLPGKFSGSLFLEKKKKTMANSGLLNNLTCPHCSTTVCTAENSERHLKSRDLNLGN